MLENDLECLRLVIHLPLREFFDRFIKKDQLNVIKKLICNQVTVSEYIYRVIRKKINVQSTLIVVHGNFPLKKGSRFILLYYTCDLLLMVFCG